MAWTIQCEAEPVNPTTLDASLWKWRLQGAGGVEHLLVFGVTGTAMSMSAGALPRGGERARATAGLSEVEQVLSWDLPPDRIEVGSIGIRVTGGKRRAP